MTRRLILTRHAKSSWDDPGLDDHDRPLNERGRGSALALGKWLASHGPLPDQVLVSSAARTRETWALIAHALLNAPKPEIRPALYLADPAEMLALLRGATGQRVMMIAHNPGTAFLAEGLARNPPPDPRFLRYPTGATTLFDFTSASWQETGWHQGAVADFIVPRDLIA